MQHCAWRHTVQAARETRKNHEKRPSGFETGTFRLRSSSVSLLTTSFSNTVDGRRRYCEEQKDTHEDIRTSNADYNVTFMEGAYFIMTDHSLRANLGLCTDKYGVAATPAGRGTADVRCHWCSSQGNVESDRNLLAHVWAGRLDTARSTRE